MRILDVPQIGKIGTKVSYRRGNVQCQRTLVIPNDPRTEDQLRWRTKVKRVRALWRTLSEQQYAGWRDLAHSHNTKRRLNQSGRFSAYLQFMQINLNLAGIDLPALLDAPERPHFGSNPVSAFAIIATEGTIALQLTVEQEPEQYVVILGTEPLGPGATYADHFTILGVLPARVGGVSDFTGLFVAKFSQPPAGSRVFIETVQQIDGWRDLPRRLSARVPAL